ncbi:MAG: carboxypeptidase M32, partial [Solobacterium sp.]|nr:carboxypeptidase M32 [Solobacterium sp.]
MTDEQLKQYNDWKFRLSAYEMALGLIGIDKLTVAPPAGATYRDERTAFLSGEHFSIYTDPNNL